MKFLQLASPLQWAELSSASGSEFTSICMKTKLWAPSWKYPSSGLGKLWQRYFHIQNTKHKNYILHTCNSFFFVMVGSSCQDGLLSLVEELTTWGTNPDDLPYRVDSACYTLQYAQRFFIEKVSATTKSKGTGLPKPMYKEKFGLLFRWNLFAALTSPWQNFF